MSETENSMWGITSNPYSLGRTPGGSSGGEAALISSGCSLMGIGSDIGGSIRIPAHFTGHMELQFTSVLYFFTVSKAL